MDAIDDEQTPVGCHSMHSCREIAEFRSGYGISCLQPCKRSLGTVSNVTREKKVTPRDRYPADGTTSKLSLEK